jgi:hypothetical protein
MRTGIRWSAPGISPLFPLLRAHAESAAAREVVEAPEAELEAQVQRPTRRMLPPEQMRLKQRQLRQPAVAVAVEVGAPLQLEPPTRRLKPLRRR